MMGVLTKWSIGGVDQNRTYRNIYKKHKEEIRRNDLRNGRREQNQHFHNNP